MGIERIEALARLLQPWRGVKGDGTGAPGPDVQVAAGTHDQVEISEIAHDLSCQQHATTDRAKRIAEIQRQIREETYDLDDDAKYEIVAERLLDDLA